MKKILLSLALLSLLASCTLGTKTETPAVSGDPQVPAEAKKMDGYEYPAVPLDQYNANSGMALPTPSGSAAVMPKMPVPPVPPVPPTPPKADAPKTSTATTQPSL